jgi:acyl-CoA thioester hydrolase
VRYEEVDQQGAVHHSRYPVYFEMGRTELLRDNGMDYRTLEENGCFLVIAKLECRYKSPARYDDELELMTTMVRADRARLEHKYELFRPADSKLLATGLTTLVHVNVDGKLQPIPDFLTPE